MMGTLPPPSVAAFSHDGRQSAAFSTVQRSTPATALLIEYFENVANKDSPSVRVKVSPFMSDPQQLGETTTFMSPLPTRENTINDRQQLTEEEEHHEQIFEQSADDTNATAPSNLDPNRGRQRTRAVSGQPAAPIEEEEPLPPFHLQTSGQRDFSDPQSLLQRSSIGSGELVSSRQVQAIIASAIQELILPEIQAVRNELTAQAQLFHPQPGLNQASNHATFGTSTSGRKRSRSLTALDTPHRRNSLSIGTAEGYHGEIVPLPPRPTSPNVPAAMEAESLLRADLRSELKITPPGTPNRATASHRLSTLTDGHHVIDPSSHTVFTLAEGAYRKRESHDQKMAALRAKRAEEKRIREGHAKEDIPEDNGDIEETILDRTRFSTCTGDRAESSIHDFIPEREEMSSHREQLAELKAQLDNVLEHLKSSAADRSGRETDILAQISVLAENTHRSLQQLKDTVLEETNVTVGALSYNIERHVERVVHGPRPLPGKKDKGLGKSASYPQDKRTAELNDNDSPPGPVKRTTTFLQGIGQALTPAPGRASREKREGMERLENMMQRVLEEVEMLKRMKQGARRKTNGEMFKGEARSRLMPPEDAITYIDEIRGDAANRERGESEEERMARIERSAQDYEEERNKRTMLASAIETETNIIRKASNEVRLSQQPLPEGSKPFQFPTGLESENREERITSRRLTPLRTDLLGTRQFTPAVTGEPPVVPYRSGAAPGKPTVEDEIESHDSYAHGDEGMFTAAGQRRIVPMTNSSSSNVSDYHRVAAHLNQVHDNSRKISIKDPVGLSSADEVIQSASARESGVLGEHLEGELGHRQSPPWADRPERSPGPPTPLSKDEQFKSKRAPVESPLPPITQDFVKPGPSKPLQNGHQRQRSQYFFKDEYGRRQYYLGDPPQDQQVHGESHEWSNNFQNFNNGLTPKKTKDKGKEREIADEASEQSILNFRSSPIVQPYETTSVQPLPSLFAATEHLETSPRGKLKKKVFRKPITVPFEIKDSPVSAPQRPKASEDVDLQRDELMLDTPEKKRRSWKLGLRSNKSQQPPQEPASLPRSSVAEMVSVSYPGPKQEVRGRNGFNYTHDPGEAENGDVLSRETTQPQSPHYAYRGSMSESVRGDAIANIQLGEHLALGHHPASMEVPPGVQWTLHQQAQHAQQARIQNRPSTPQDQTEEAMVQPQVNSTHTPENVIVGPFANPRVNRNFTPTPPIRDPLPARHLIPDGLLPDTTYAPTAPLSPQKSQTSTHPRRSPTPADESLYNATAIRQAFSNNLNRRPTPPRASMPATRAPRMPSNLAEQKPARRPTTLKEQKAQLTEADMASNGHTSPTKTESSYKTAIDIDGDQERSNDGVRPPSTYSHGSIGGGRFSRNRARTPPDDASISDSADFSSSTRPFDSNPPAPAKYLYDSRSPRNSQMSNLNKPQRVPSGPRNPPPNFSTIKPPYGQDRYSRPSFASDVSRRTSGDTESIAAVLGTAVRTDLTKGTGTVTANWVSTRKASEPTKA